MDVFFCLLTGVWANICGVEGWGPVGGGGGELIDSSLRYFISKYRKIPKISPGAKSRLVIGSCRGLYVSKALYEGLIFGVAYIRRSLSTEGYLRFKIDLASLIAGRKFTVFALFYFVFEGNFQVQAPGWLIFGGAN